MSRENRLTPVDRYAGDNNIAQTQSSNIIHALAHIYAPAPLAYTQETYPINGCLGLDTSNGLNNANNYVYLAAGKTTLHFSFDSHTHGVEPVLTCFSPPVIHAACPSFYDLNSGGSSTHSPATADTSSASTPAVLDDWAYDIAFDANALQANLTALGY